MAESTLNGCCDESPANPKDFNPKMQRRRRSGKLQLFDIQNPIPAEVADADELKKVFREYHLVPYAGSTMDSGHSLLVWYLSLAKLSNTHGTCISKLGKYAFGGKAVFVSTEDPEYQITGVEPKQVSPETGAAYYEALTQNVTFSGGARKFHRSVGWSTKATGNAFVELVMASTLGQNHFNIVYHKPTHCLYRNTEPGEMRVIGVSPIWTEEYIRRKGIRWVPLYPNFVKESDGTLRTMFHHKSGENSWYGRPDTDFADLQKAQEAQHALYLIKQANANFMGQLIIEVEDDNPENGSALDDQDSQLKGFDSFADEFEHNYTMKSDDPQAVLLSSRPFGSRPMFVFQVKPNTNENWYKVTGDDAADRIMRAHGCTKRFLGFEVKSGLSGADAYFTDHIVNMEPVINEYRNEILIFTNSILAAIWDLNNTPQLNEISLSFTSPIQGVVDDFKQRQQNQPQENGILNNGIRGGQIQSGG